MNHKMVFSTVGKVLLSEAAMLCLPLGVALYRSEPTTPIVVALAVALALGWALNRVFRPRDHTIYAKDGFVIVALSWLLLSAVGALPFVISGEIPRYVDAFFETVSGFTTTGASIVPNVEVMSRSLLFWRSFTHWVGGMGILVFAMAIVPGMSDRSIHIMRAEMPGPVVGKLVPRAKDTARILYRIYIAMTVLEIILLLAGGMPLFDSVVHSFGTAGTGGFGIKSDSIASYSPYLQWIITVFMLLFGVNFNLYFLLLIRRFRSVAKSTELWAYLALFAVSVMLISTNILHMYDSFAEALRHAAFQVSSIMTTTGFSTFDFDSWPLFSKAILLGLMFIGACAGSTGGGIKVSRVVLLLKSAKRELMRLVHPRSVTRAHFEGKTVDISTLHSVSTYLIVYVACFSLIVLFLCLEPEFNFLSNFSAAAACFNNIGPGLSIVGPARNYALYSDGSKLLLSFAMLLGRLEIFPLLITLTPATWTKR
ncbi:MAG: TrkH family potassium uptake protein [Oscillospiraceae bacterium]|nr:TrkH family potassium uptake protein [Oscillospiraceae bacterium]